MEDLDKLVDGITDSTALCGIIANSKNYLLLECDRKTLDKAERESHNGEKEFNQIPLCQSGLIGLLARVVTTKPKLVDESVKDSVSAYFTETNIKPQGFISNNILLMLHETKYPLLTWLKYELLLCHLIKQKIYEPKAIADEVLTTVKNYLNSNIAARFSSVLASCVKQCRETNGRNNDDEEEGKWCEIIDWMSWFLVGPEDENIM